MTSERFLEELHLILGAPPGVLKPDTKLADFPAWDSMGKMAALTLIDSDVGLPVPSGLVQQWKTVGEILEFVSSRLQP